MADGLELDRLLARAFAADDIFEAREDIAYDESLGYLTASPANVGTGLRAGVMLHLPGLFAAKQIDKLAENAASVGIVLQGLFNEKGEAGSNLFRIYNQFTIGFSEAEIINNLKATAGKLIAQERKARRALYKDSADDVEDRVWRSFGILQYARIITRAEALRLLSDVRLGIDLSLIKNVRAEVFNELLIATRNGFLQHCQGSSNLSPQENDKLRAAIIRKALTGDGA
jgi:protein arginine kinase